MEDADGWTVKFVEHIPVDCNWRCVVTKDTRERVVFCYFRVSVNEVINLRKAGL